MMRTRMVVTLGLVLTLTGCAADENDGGSVATARSGTPAATSSPTADSGQDAPLKYARCMREHGMTWFPDPNPDGGIRIRTPKDLDPKKMDAAQRACRRYEPNGGAGPQANPAEIEQARQMAKCMRANGVPNFPDPNPNGGITVNRGKFGTGPGEPAFDKAERICARYRPSSPEKARA